MRNACRITKATNTHSEYVILIAFLLQQWLHEHTPVLRYAYIGCLVSTSSREMLKENTRRSHSLFSETYSIMSQAEKYTLFAPQFTNDNHKFTVQLQKIASLFSCFISSQIWSSGVTFRHKNYILFTSM